MQTPEIPKNYNEVVANAKEGAGKVRENMAKMAAETNPEKRAELSEEVKKTRMELAKQLSVAEQAKLAKEIGAPEQKPARYEMAA